MHSRSLLTLLVCSSLIRSTVAHGSEIFLNGLAVQGVRDLSLSEVSVRFDALGDLHVYAPGHQVTPALEGAMAQRAPKGHGVEYGRWWLVGEDLKSTGHHVEVWISGLRVAKISSQGEPVMLDLGPYLAVGDNVITLRGGSGVTASGTLAIYVGEARVKAGTLNLNEPSISIFCRTTCPVLKQETLRVP